LSLLSTVIYSTSPDNKYRYALGVQEQFGKGDILYCFGVNPSTATPEKYDPTIKRVIRVTNKLGYDSWTMFNLYPRRATNPANLDMDINEEEHEKNLKAISTIKNGSTVWAAWGDLVDTRPFLRNCLSDILTRLKEKEIKWVKMGELTKNGNPRHPLYLKYQPFSEFVT